MIFTQDNKNTNNFQTKIQIGISRAAAVSHIVWASRLNISPILSELFMTHLRQDISTIFVQYLYKISPILKDFFTTHLNISQILSKLFTTHLRQDNQAKNTVIFNQIILKQKYKWFSNQNTYKNSRSAWIFLQFWKNYLRPTWGKIFHPPNFIFRRVSIAAICFPVNFQILSTSKEKCQISYDKITIRDGDSTALYAVYTFDSFEMVYTVTWLTLLTWLTLFTCFTLI